MKRREFIAGLGAAAASSLSWTLIAGAQRSATPIVGFLNAGSAEIYTLAVAAFRRALAEGGFVEGRNVRVEYRWADGQYDRLPALAAQLVDLGAAVIAAGGGPAVLAAKAASATVPVVFSAAADPVQSGLVASLARPGGNVTGVTNLNVEVGPKRLELLREAVPSATSFAVLMNPSNPNRDSVRAREMQAAAHSLGVALQAIEASTEHQVEAAFAKLQQLQAGGLLIDPDPFFNTRSKFIAALTLRHRVPAIYQYPEFVAAGGLMSYGGSITENYRLVGSYTSRILKGDKPADLPVQQSAKVELLLNLKIAGALGLTVPPSLRVLANEVIE